MIDTRAYHNVMPHNVMKKLGLECTQTFKSIIIVDS